MDRFQRTYYKVKEDIQAFTHGLHHDQGKTIKQICKENGYLLREYKYTTEDGYINTVFRLHGKRAGKVILNN